MHFLFTGSISRAIEAMTTHTLPSMLGMLRVHRRKKSQLTACRCHLHSHILGSKGLSDTTILQAARDTGTSGEQAAVPLARAPS